MQLLFFRCKVYIVIIGHFIQIFWFLVRNGNHSRSSLMNLLLNKLNKHCNKKHKSYHPIYISGKKIEGGKYFSAEECINP
jgi:hypothetical protein